MPLTWIALASLKERDDFVMDVGERRIGENVKDILFCRIIRKVSTAIGKVYIWYDTYPKSSGKPILFSA